MASTKTPTKSRRKPSKPALFGSKGLIISRAKNFPRGAYVTATFAAIVGIVVLVVAYASNTQTAVNELFSTASPNFTTVAGGTWAFTNGHYTLTNPAQAANADSGNANYAIHKFSDKGDFTESVDFYTTPTSASFNDASVIWDWINASNYMFASFNESNNSTTNGIFKVVDGVQTQLVNFTRTFQPGVLRHAVVNRTGTSYSATVDGAVVGTVGTSGLTGGRLGFGSRNDSVYFDNFVVTVPGSSTPSPVPPPPVTGKPGPSNTGVPVGTVLKRYNGNLTISKAGEVVDSLDIYGSVKIEAPNVTFKRSRIHGTPNTDLLWSVQPGVLIEDSELVADYPSLNVDGLKGYGFTAKRMNIHATVDTVVIYGNNTTIEDSYLWDNRQYAHDPAQNGTPSHDDGVQVQGGSNIHILHNNILGGHNTSIQVTQDYAVVSNLTIDRNWSGRGNCTYNEADKAPGPIHGLVITNNRFYRNAGISYCQVLLHTQTSKLTKFSGNVHDDDSKPVNPVVVNP